MTKCPTAAEMERRIQVTKRLVADHIRDLTSAINATSDDGRRRQLMQMRDEACDLLAAVGREAA
jgi:hypothetical protein